MPQPKRQLSIIPIVERPACPTCKAPMILVSIELADPGIDLQKFDCDICNSVLESFAPYDDPMKSGGLARWLQGDLYPPK
jgi:hypothetical protein